MAEGRQRDEWDKLSLIIATIHNTQPFRGKNARTWHPRDFNPYTIRDRRQQNDIERERDALHAFFETDARQPQS